MEAHSAESEARRAFSLELAEEDILSLARPRSFRGISAQRLRAGGAHRCHAGNESSTTLFYGLTGKARRAGAEFGEVAQAFCKALPDLFFYDTNKRSKGYETVDLWLNDEIRHGSLFQNIARLGRAMAERAREDGDGLPGACRLFGGY